MSSITTITTLEGDVYDIRASGIPYGRCDSTSTATAFTVTVPGITSLHDGVCALIKNGVVTSASGCTLNINGLGAKPIYSSMAAATALTSVFNVNYTMLFVYDETRVNGGCWIAYYGYYTSSNTIGYQIRAQSATLPTLDKFYRYRMLFTSPDGTAWVPSNTSDSTSASTRKTPNTRPFNPFGPIAVYATTAAVNAGVAPSAPYVWTQNIFVFGYAFNDTGAALNLDVQAPVYIIATPQSDGSAILYGYTQTLPSTEDGKIYIFIGYAYDATHVELFQDKPIFYYKDGSIRLWTNAPTSGGGTGPSPSDSAPQPLGTASAGVSDDYSRADHVHAKPTYTASEVGAYELPSGGIPKTDLASGVQDSLDAADSAYQKPSGGIPASDLASGVIPSVPTKVSDLQNDSGFITGMEILSYGISTWSDFRAAYDAKKVVYCRASSNSNPATGLQTLLAFMAYVYPADKPSSVEFQYYRSVSSHTDAQQGDQVYVYKLESNGTWTVTVREAYTKIVAGTGLSSSYSSGTLTLNNTGGGSPVVTEVTVSTSGSVTQALDAGTIYHFTGALSALTVTATDPTVGTYQFDFISGSTVPTLTVPASWVMPDNFIVEPSARYSLTVENGYCSMKKWSDSHSPFIYLDSTNGDFTMNSSGLTSDSKVYANVGSEVVAVSIGGKLKSQLANNTWLKICDVSANAKTLIGSTYVESYITVGSGKVAQCAFNTWESASEIKFKNNTGSALAANTIIAGALIIMRTL